MIQFDEYLEDFQFDLRIFFKLGWLFNHQQTFCLLGLPGWCSPSVHPTKEYSVLHGLENLEDVSQTITKGILVEVISTWRIIPVSKWLITLVGKCPKSKRPKLQINGGY